MSVTTESPGTPVPSSSKPGGGQPRRVGGGLLDPKILWKSLPDAFKKLDPRVQIKNPVMFVVEVGSVLTLYTAIKSPSVFNWTIVVWLWLTVVFANLAEAVAEGRGKAQAETLRRAKRETMARRLTNWQAGMEASALREESVAGTALQLGDYVVVEAGQVIPGDGDVIEGVASVDESAITGESAPVIRESGGDRSAVTGGTTVLSDRIVVKITSKPGETFIDRMIALVEGAKRQKTPNEIALNILLASLTIIFMLAVITLQPMAYYSDAPQSLVILVALLVALIPTTIGALLSAIGIAGMDRLVQRNVLAVSGRAVEAAGDVNTLLLDKTGTITIGNRQASEFLPVGGATAEEVANAAQLSSMADYTPEGRSIVVLAKNEYGLRERHEGELAGAEFVEFTAQTRMSGIDLADGRQVRKGASSAVREWIRANGGTPPEDLGPMVDGISAAGGTPLVVAEKANGSAQAVGVIHLKDIVKQGISERFDEMRKMGIRTVMITGDNPLTAKAIADESGVDDFLAEATPEDKMALIKQGAAGRQAGRDDRRRHQRRPGAGPGRRRRGHEHRHLGRQGGREHGGPGLQPDQAHRDRGDRQAAADHPGRADHVLHHQRRGQVLRHHPGHVLGRDPGPGQAQHPAPVQPEVGDHLGDHLQRADHRRADPAGAARGALQAVLGVVDAPQEPADLRPRRADHPVHRHLGHRPDRPVHPRIRQVSAA